MQLFILYILLNTYKSMRNGIPYRYDMDNFLGTLLREDRVRVNTSMTWSKYSLRNNAEPHLANLSLNIKRRALDYPDGKIMTL